MDTAHGTPGPARADVPRRMLLAIGGMVLLGGCAVTDSSRRNPAGPVPSAAPRPSGPASAHPRPVRPVADRRPGAGRRRHLTIAADEQPMYYIHDGHRAIALTIDDGPSPIYTPQVLGLLHRYGITASFSMIGINVGAYPGVAREVADAGHVIVNHTQTHRDLAFMPPAKVADEMDYATEAIHRATGGVPHMFRAPYGAWSPAVLQRCHDTGMTPLDWSVDPRDWTRPGVTAIVAGIMDHTRSGSIILEHDGGGNRSQTVAALRVVIPRLLDAGYRFRTP
ncbi:MAG TPA: polysaccharide deacetylase family protein [Streptosporangiaceae bacterium]|nr:polysaccharide deacetylase family protein [Streptosporangiaceae bacterium]